PDSGEVVHKGVAGRIAGLPGVADDRGQRGEQEENVEGLLPGREVEVEGAENLRSQDLFKGTGLLVADQGVMYDPRRMQHAVEPAKMPARLDDSRFGLGTNGHVAAEPEYLPSQPLKI